jgi:DNA polymerase V
MTTQGRSIAVGHLDADCFYVSAERFHGVDTSKLTVAIQYKTGHAGVAQRKPPVPSDRFDLLLEAARPCLRKARLPGV